MSNLMLGHSLPKRQFDGAALLDGQPLDGLPDGLSRSGGVGVIGEIRQQIQCFCAFLAALPPDRGADCIDRAPMGQHPEVGPQGAAFGVEPLGVAPQGREDLLEHVVRCGVAAGDATRQTENKRSVAVENLCERCVITCTQSLDEKAILHAGNLTVGAPFHNNFRRIDDRQRLSVPRVIQAPRRRRMLCNHA